MRDIETEVAYATHAVASLSSAWMRREPNRSGLRATFRRWRPTASGEPTLEMERLIWGWVGDPGAPAPTKDLAEGELLDNSKTTDEDSVPVRLRAGTVSRTAVIVALRAVAGDHPPTFNSIGSALHRTDINDLRMMRFLTAPKSGRLESLFRAFKLIDAKRLGVRWSNKEIERILSYLYGREEQARASVSYWASDFFASRGKTEEDGDAATADNETADDNITEPTEQSTKE